MSKTKSKILATSRRLFNEKGYADVTIRMIALELKMSSGNLNYHFKKRADILEALYFEMVEEFDKRVENLGTTKITLKSAKEDISRSMERMMDYQFFWTDFYNLLRLNEKIERHYKEVYEARVNGYRYLFQVFIEGGVMREFEFNTEQEFLIERMIGFSNTWLYNSSVYDRKVDADYISDQANNLMSMLYPYLSDSGKVEYRKLFPTYFT